MNRKQRLEEIQKRLDKRKLIWLGFRGSDARVLLDITSLIRVFSITAPLEGVSGIAEVSLETLQRRRLDLHPYDPDLDRSPEARELHRLFSAALAEPAAVLTYRPDNFLTSACFPHLESVEYLGLFHVRQSAFEHKPWVETELRKSGVRTIPWRYYGPGDLPSPGLLLAQGPLVVRSSHSAGGAGLALVRDQCGIDLQEQFRQDPLLAVAPYLEPNIPINVSACVFPDGNVSLHGPSVQLIGIASCTGYPLGYCGNDFAQVRNLDSAILDEFEAMTVCAGKWLRQMGYIGAFGIDAVVYHDHVYLSEINPRFQNSSVVSAEIDGELGRPDLYLNHMAACYGRGGPPFLPLREIASQQRVTSQIICYNCNSEAVYRSQDQTPECGNLAFSLLPAPEVAVAPGGMMFRAAAGDSVTRDGHSLREEYERQIRGFTGRMFGPRGGDKSRETQCTTG